MTSQPNIKLTIAISDTDLDQEEIDKVTRNILREMRELDVEKAELAVATETPEGAKDLGAVLIGTLMAQVSEENLKKLFSFLSDRLGNKVTEMTVETPDGRKLSIKASSKVEFEFAMQKAEEFINNK